MISDLIKQFSAKENSEFLKSLPNGTRSKSLYLAYKYSNDKKVIFEKVYLRKYQDSDDYLLRAEKKILKKKIEAFIYNPLQNVTESHQVYSVYYQMCLWCLKKGLNEIAEKYIQKSYQEAEKICKWQDLLRINRQWYIVEFQSKIPIILKAPQLKKRTDAHEMIIKKMFSEEMRLQQYLISSTEKLQHALGEDYLEKEIENSMHIDLTENETAFGSYFKHKTLSFKKSENNSIYHLKKAIKILESSPNFYFKDSEELAITGALATEYTKSNQYEKACIEYEKLIHNPSLQNSIASPNIHFNYLSTLLKLEHFEQAEKIIHLIEERHPNFTEDHQFNAMKINTYLRLDSPDKLKKSISSLKGSQDNSMKIYQRVLLSIYYFQRNTLDLAERELFNIEKMKGIKNSQFYPMVSLLKLYNVFLIENGKKQIQIKKQLAEMILELKLNSEHNIQESMPFKWLEFKLK